MIFAVKSIILGIIQGLTEFVPVSSSGHLVLAKHFMEFDTQGISFEIVLHLGTVLSVLIFFRKEIISLLSSLVKYSDKSGEHVANRRILLYLAVSTAVTGVIGIIFKKTIEEAFQKPFLTAIMLLVTGGVIFISDFFKDKKIACSDAGIWRSCIIGLSQACAIIPGLSRSGSTITASLAVGIKREEAARFSFLLSIPAILGAAILDLRKMTSIESSHLWGYFWGAFAAFITGYLVISFLLDIIKKRKLRYISYYCWVVAVGVLVLLFFGF